MNNKTNIFTCVEVQLIFTILCSAVEVTQGRDLSPLSVFFLPPCEALTPPPSLLEGVSIHGGGYSLCRLLLDLPWFCMKSRRQRWDNLSGDAAAGAPSQMQPKTMRSHSVADGKCGSSWRCAPASCHGNGCLCFSLQLGKPPPLLSPLFQDLHPAQHHHPQCLSVCLLVWSAWKGKCTGANWVSQEAEAGVWFDQPNVWSVWMGSWCSKSRSLPPRSSRVWTGWGKGRATISWHVKQEVQQVSCTEFLLSKHFWEIFPNL